jgi:CheY-like chemotaxis protein
LTATVLLVEDNRIQKLVNERILHKAGYTVLHAADGEEAVRLARQTIPDIVLLDMLLPKLGGREVMQALRETSSTAQIPVLVLSGLPQSNEAKLKKEGAAGYFQKSRLAAKGDGEDEGEAELLELIERLIQESKARQKGQPVSAAHLPG